MKKHIKGCKDCKWLDDNIYCTSPNINIDDSAIVTITNFLTGEVKNKIIESGYSLTIRDARDGPCGIEARWFEQKEQSENEDNEAIFKSKAIPPSLVDRIKRLIGEKK